MKLSNGTNQELYYQIAPVGGSGDCGDLGPQDSADVGYDNRSDIIVKMGPKGGKLIDLVVAQTGVGKTVTLAMFFS